MATSVHSGEVPAAHVSTDQWQSFEMRMRKRRVERLLARSAEACEAGREDVAREALAEIEQLSPLEPRLAELRARVDTVSAASSPALASPVVAIEEKHAIKAFESDEITFPVVIPPSSEASVTSVPLDLPLIVDDSDQSPEPVAAVAEQRRSGLGLAFAAAALLACGAAGWFLGPRLMQLLPRETATVQGNQEPTEASARGASNTTVPAREEPTPTEPLDPVRVAVDEVAAANTTVDAASNDREPIREAPAQPASFEPRSPEPVTHAPAPAFPSAPVPARSVMPPLPDPEPSPSVSAVPNAAVPTAERPAPIPALVEPANAPIRPTPPVSTNPETNAPASPAPPSARDAANTVPRDEERIRAVLDQYASAYSRLDAAAASAIFPGIDQRALARAFDGLASQKVSLGSCDVRPASDSAIVDCAGSATWTPKIGGGTRTESRRWQFRLRNESGDWRIVATKVR